MNFDKMQNEVLKNLYKEKDVRLSESSVEDGSTATEAIELNIHQDNSDDTFNPFGE